MNEKDVDPDLLERFVDGRMNDEEAREFMTKFANPEELLQQQKLQKGIDASLKRLFKSGGLDAETITNQYLDTHGSDANKLDEDSPVPNLRDNRQSERSQPYTPYKLAIAALLLISLGLAIWNFRGARSPIVAKFEERPLAELYLETNQRGFRPYYNCEDDKRFADTFEVRQGQPLALGELPVGTRMLGLSYLGGMSRNTTAMLGEVDSARVIVFVDTVENRDRLMTAASPESELQIFIEEKNGLIFCEVTPLEAPMFIKHFEFPNQVSQ